MDLPKPTERVSTAGATMPNVEVNGVFEGINRGQIGRIQIGGCKKTSVEFRQGGIYTGGPVVSFKLICFRQV